MRKWIHIVEMSVVTGEDAAAGFETWFGASKVVDSTGQPLVVYHGTPHQFTHFDPTLRRRDRGYFGTGAYFSSSPSIATSYGKNLHAVYLSLQHPLILELSSFIDYQQWPQTHFPGMSNDDIRAALEFEGYDGIIISVAHETAREFVAFYPQQIRPADDGTRAAAAFS